MNIKPDYKHTRLGNFMFKLCARVSEYLMYNRPLYYILSFTIGIVNNILGFIVFLSLLLTFHKPFIYNGNIGFKIGRFWGGFNLGIFFVRDKESSITVSDHEVGHSYQDAFLGIISLLIIQIPSVIRYWYRYLKYERKGLDPKTDYDAMWFEDNATQIGIFYDIYLDTIL